VPTKWQSSQPIDNSAQMTKFAKNTFLNKDNPNLTFHNRCRKTCFCQEFDIAFSNAALHWIIDQKAVLQGIQRSLKPKGRLVVQMAGKGNAQEIIAILTELLTENSWKQYFTDFTFPCRFF
jgi:trans-aconitate 2-methyltransferase